VRPCLHLCNTYHKGVQAQANIVQLLTCSSVAINISGLCIIESVCVRDLITTFTCTAMLASSPITETAKRPAMSSRYACIQSLHAGATAFRNTPALHTCRSCVMLYILHIMGPHKSQCCPALASLQPWTGQHAPVMGATCHHVLTVPMYLSSGIISNGMLGYCDAPPAGGTVPNAIPVLTSPSQVRPS
jgi:hypothetical protein